MNICNAPLAYSFAKSPWQLWISYILGTMGIWGWGLGFEAAFRKRFKGFSFCHAFIEGTVIVSFIMLYLSVFGIWRVEWPMTILGVLIGLAALWVEKRGSARGFRELRLTLSQSKKWEWGLVLLLVFPTAFSIVATPFHFGDTSVIWLYHAKALSCGPLFETGFFREKVWTGTHPDYPLFLSYIYSLFFSLADSFRDDWIKLWQSVLFVCAILVGYFEIKRSFQGRLIAFTGTVTVLAVFTSLLFNARIELSSAVFVWLFSLCLLSGDRWRISTYLLGFLFCKNEGLAGSFVLVAMSIGYVYYNKGKLKDLSYLAPWAIFTGLWLCILVQLPSHSMEYPSHLVSLEAWRAGISRIPLILKGCAGLMWAGRVWRLMFYTIPLLVLLALFVRTLRKSEFFETFVTLLFFTVGMLGIFLVIYIVSPWSDDLYTITFDRLFAQLYPAITLSLITLLGMLWVGKNIPVRKLSAALQVFLIVYYSVSIKNDSGGMIKNFVEAARKDLLGINSYTHIDTWVAAFRLDKELPPASRGAVLFPKYFYYANNFTLFPRVFYPTEPDTIAGTNRDFYAWESVKEVPWQRLQLQFIVDEKNDKILLEDDLRRLSESKR